MTDDDRLIRLLRLFDDEPARPARIDLLGAIAEARRRTRNRRIMGATGAAALTVAVVATLPATLPAVRPDGPTGDRGRNSLASAPSPAPAASAAASGSGSGSGSAAASGRAPGLSTSGRLPPPRSCTVERLPVAGPEQMSLVTGADPTGRFVLGRAYPSGGKRTYPILIWDGGSPTRVKLPGADQSLYDITSTGVAVGAGWTDEGPEPYLVRDGRASRLPGAKTGVARAINEAGRIVGYRDGRQPVLWPSATADPVDLPLPGPDWRGEAVDIDSDGTTVGVVTAPNSRDELPRLWLPDGTGRMLPLPTVRGKPATNFRPQSIRNGWVTGVAGVAGGGVGGGGEANAPVRLHLASGTFADLPENQVWPQHGNGQGWVVGSTPTGRAALVTDAGQLVLPDLDNHRTDTANLAWTVSDDGRTVAGQADNAKGDPQAVLWRCR